MIVQAFRNRFKRVIDTIAPPTIAHTAAIDPHNIDASEDAFVADLCRVFRHYQDELESMAQGLIAQIKCKEADIARLRAANTRDGLSLPLIGTAQSASVQLRAELRRVEYMLAQSHMPDKIITREQYRDMLKTPGLLLIAIRERRMVYHTSTLFGKDHDGFWRRIGRFEISFDIVAPQISTFRWKNIDGPIGQNHGPPNIVAVDDHDYGSVRCPGSDANNIIIRGLHEYTFPELVSFSIRYPECAGLKPQRGYVPTITLWPRVEASEVPQWYIDQFGA